MTPIVKTNLPEFQAALREWADQTTRALRDGIKARMFYVLLRAYALMDPVNPNSARNAARGYLNQPVAISYRNSDTAKLLEAHDLNDQKGIRAFRKRITLLRRLDTKRAVLRVYLIAQAIRKKSGLPTLSGRSPSGRDLMKKNVAKLRRRGISAAGYVKSSLVKAMKRLNEGGFAQFGFSAKYRRELSFSFGKRKYYNKILTKPEVGPNAALAKIAAEYGLDPAGGNVGVFKSAKGTVRFSNSSKANPSIEAELDILVRSGEDSAVQQRLAAAINRALADETAAIRQHLAAKAQEVANAYSA